MGIHTLDKLKKQELLSLTSDWLNMVSFIFQLIAKGKNASELFPAVVKNVASKNIEVWLLITGKHHLSYYYTAMIHFILVQQSTWPLCVTSHRELLHTEQ